MGHYMSLDTQVIRFFFAIQIPMLFAHCIIKDFLAIITTLDNMQRKTRNNNPWHA